MASSTETSLPHGCRCPSSKLVRQISLIFLLCFPALAELEVTLSEVVSHRPDGLGHLVRSDLDGDGDLDLLVTGRRNDFLGWIESSSSGSTGPLNPINTGDIPVANQRPILIDLDGSGFPDIHFPGWKIPVAFRSFGSPVVNPTTVDYEFLTANEDMIIARSKSSGEWVRITQAGILPLSQSGTVFQSPSAPGEGQVHIGDMNRDGSIDLLAVMDGVTQDGSEIPAGLYWLPLNSVSPAPRIVITNSLPRLVTPVYHPYTPGRITGVLAGYDRVIIDDNPPYDPPVPITAIQLHSPGHTELSLWSTRNVINAGPRATALEVYETSDPQKAIFEVAAPDPLYNTGTLRSYQLNPTGHEGTTTELGIHFLNEPGNCKILLQEDSDSRLLTFSSSDSIEGAETIRRVKTADLVAMQPISGKLIAGPFGTLAHATWEDLEQDENQTLVAATDACEALLLFDPTSLQAPRSLTSLSSSIFRDLGVNGPPIIGDFDRDGDTDIARTFRTSYSGYLTTLWEKLGDTQFEPVARPYIAVGGEWLGYMPFRVDQDPDSNRLRILSSKPGMMTSSGFPPISGDPSYAPVVYPGSGAEVVASDQDIDGDGVQDIVFYPSVFGNALAWGKWNPTGGYLDSLDLVAPVSQGIAIPQLTSGDLDGDGNVDLFHPALDVTAMEVSWIANRIANGTLTAFSHPPISLPETTTRVLPVDLDNDGDMDLIRFVPDLSAPLQPDGIRLHKLRWTEYVGGLWVHHQNDLGKLRTSAELPEPVLKTTPVTGGTSTLLVNRIGEILEIQTHVTTSDGALASLLAAEGITGASSGAEDDPDGDGIPNFAEIIAGTSPTRIDTGFSIPLEILNAGVNSGWIASLPVSLEELGARARLETSDNLTTWNLDDSPPLPLGMDGSRYRYLFSDSAVNLSSSPRRFARIIFTQP